MKKIFAVSILAVMLFSCVSSGSGTNESGTVGSPVSLERAIELAAEHIAGDLKPGSRIAIVDFESVNDHLSHHIMEELTGELLKHNIEIADRQSLPYIFEEFKFQMSGAVSDETAQSLGKILGAELIIVGRLLDIVTMYRNQVDAVHVEMATRESAARNNVRKDQALRRMINALASQQTTVKVYRYGVTEQTKPETAGTFLDRGIMYAMRGEYDKAIADFDEAIRLNPNLVGAYMLRGRALDASVSRVIEVLENFNGIITASYTGDRASSEQVRIYDRAITDYTQAIRLDPHFAEAYNSRGATYTNKGDYDRAVADYTEAIRLNPHFAQAYTNRGNAYADKGDYDQAVADHTQAISLAPDLAEAYTNRGVAYADKGDYDRAVADHTHAIRLNSRFASAFVNRGNSYVKNIEYDRALSDYTRAITIDPNFIVAYANRGLLYVYMFDFDKAIKDWETILRIDPNNSEAKQSIEHIRQIDLPKMFGN